MILVPLLLFGRILTYVLRMTLAKLNENASLFNFMQDCVDYRYLR